MIFASTRGQSVLAMSISVMPKIGQNYGDGKSGIATHHGRNQMKKIW